MSSFALTPFSSLLQSLERWQEWRLYCIARWDSGICARSSEGHGSFFLLDTLVEVYDLSKRLVKCLSFSIFMTIWCFRKMYDVIVNPVNIGSSDDGSIPYVAFEWLETTLADVQHQPGKHNYAIVKTIVNTVLTSCIILADRQLANTGRTPDLKGLASANQRRLQANIMLSGIETDDITAKVGDLGLGE